MAQGKKQYKKEVEKVKPVIHHDPIYHRNPTPVVTPKVEPKEEVKANSNTVTLKCDGRQITVPIGTEASIVCDMLNIMKSGRSVYIDGVSEELNRYVSKNTKEITLG